MFLMAALLLATVSRAQVVVSADCMNVMYSGVENPITVAVPNMPQEGLIVTIPDSLGSIKAGEGPGQFIVVPYGKNPILTVTVADKNGNTLGGARFRVKRMPSPWIIVGGLHSGGAPENKKVFQAGTRVIAIKTPDFDLKVNPSIMRVVKIRGSINNKPIGDGVDAITEEMYENIKMASAGDRLFITATVAMPDGIPVAVEWEKVLEGGHHADCDYLIED